MASVDGAAVAAGGREEAATQDDVDELREHLDEMNKTNALLEMENEVFEAYLLRHNQQIDDEAEEEEEDTGGRRRGRRRGGKKSKNAPDLRAEQKLEVAANELDQAQKDAEGKEGELKEAIDIQKAVLSSLGMRIQDLEKEAFEFKRDIVLGAENARTGKIMAEKLARWMDERLKSKDAVIEKLRLKNSTLRTRIAKLKSQLKQKQEVGGVLHYIDFHQLQIENKQYLARIEERNTQLLDLKVSTGATVQTLNALKQRLSTLVAECAWRRQEIRTRQERLGKLDSDIDSAQGVVSKHRRMAERLQVAVEQAEDMPAVHDYVSQREEHSLLEKEVRNWQRKVEIADMASKRAKTLMRKSQQGQLGGTAASASGSTVAFGGSMALGGTALSATSVQSTPFGTKRRGGLYTGVALAQSGAGKK